VIRYLVSRDDDELTCRARGAACRYAARQSRLLRDMADLPGEQAVRLVLPPEDQGSTLVQLSRPREQWRLWWIAGWDLASGITPDVSVAPRGAQELPQAFPAQGDGAETP